MLPPRLNGPRAVIGGCWLLALAVIIGCRSGQPSSAGGGDTVDRPLLRETEKAVAAFHAGYDDEALRRYRLALARAWELDDSAEIATAAFNLAAASAANDDWNRARQALAETRAELTRQPAPLVSVCHVPASNHSLAMADVWLLEAKIARAEGRLAEAAYFADCLASPAIAQAPECRSDHSRSPRWSLASWTSCSGQSHAPQTDDCHQATISLRLLRANLALDHGDLAAAQAELNCLPRCQQAGSEPGCDPATLAEIAAVQARLLLQQQRPDEAARWLDQEAIWLRQSGHWREIPRATSAAAAAYLSADRMAEASDRYLRTARILYGRGDRLAALDFLQQAAELSVQLEDHDLQLRGELLLTEIESQEAGANAH